MRCARPHGNFLPTIMVRTVRASCARFPVFRLNSMLLLSHSARRARQQFCCDDEYKDSSHVASHQLLQDTELPNEEQFVTR